MKLFAEFITSSPNDDDDDDDEDVDDEIFRWHMLQKITVTI